MPKHLVIVESPAKCKKIAGFLGPDFQVLATMGHIRALEEDLDAVGIDRDFEPRFRFLQEKAKAMKPILAAASGADIIYLAADDDREGEAIAYSVACLLKKDPTTMPRAIFHEITEKAVKNAIAAAQEKRIDMNRVYAQQARSVLDMLVGFTISPLLWKHVARGLSAGRCQTPALRLVYDREKQVKSHSTQTTWTIQGAFSTNTSEFTAKMLDELEDQESALNYLENIYEDTTAYVKDVCEKPWTLSAPPPLITSTLQQEASALHHCNPKATMKSAQELYEAGHITYMRTDCAVLCEEAITHAKEWVTAKYGAEFIGTQIIKAKVKAQPKAQQPEVQAKGQPQVQAQEAHEAIRPTHMELEQLPAGEWKDIDRKIYALIRRRAIQSVMAPARGRIRTITLILHPDPEPFVWTSSLRKTDFLGWQILGKPASLDDTEDEGTPEDTEWEEFQKILAGTPVTWTSLQSSPKRSKAQPRFTEATLIRELEHKGIGRPSTFASLIEVLFDKLYVEKKDIPGSKASTTTYTLTPSQWPPDTTVSHVILGAEKSKLMPTELGESVLGFCIREFPQLFGYEFTAQMEQRLDKISRGEEQWKQLCRDTWNSYKDSHVRLKDTSSVPQTSEKLKDFGQGFKAVMTKKGPLLVQENGTDKPTFYSFPPDTSVLSITLEEAKEWIAKLATDSTVGNIDGKPVFKKKGPYGFYLEFNSLKIPYVEGDTLEQITEKFKSRKVSAPAYKLGPYQFAVGQYGPYMFKEGLKTRKFVSLPKDIDVRKLTGAEADALYSAGIKKGSGSGWKGGRNK